ncbi:lipase family protein [Nocardia cyriacigeorgica]|uniref:lipase family protein n=1 Tax=Nocardia cyriacigeorgica TaxID=135487 RepID=UPI00245454D2|nr:lipase family protein [Nocardia cyriacigeorgica]
MRSRVLKFAAAVAGPMMMAGGGAIAAPAASAEPTPAVAADFYVPPAPLPGGGAGTIIRAEQSNLALSAPGIGGPIPAAATRIMHLSADTHGNPAAAVATYLEPSQPWTGPGERPLIAYAGGSKGQGDHCAPSKGLSNLVQYHPPFDASIEYDVLAIYSLLGRGMGVVVTDYLGLGTPAVHDFLNRKSQAHALLDAARAALRLPGTGLHGGSPVVLYGYSQGGMASAAAAELQPDYAPELNVKGAYVGGAVVDDISVIAHNDGRAAFAPAFAWLLNGIAADYPETRPVLDAELNDTGKGILNDAAGKCAVPFGMAQNHAHTAQWTTSGQPLTAVIDRSPALRAAFADQRVGGLRPSAPVFISQARNDDGAPFGPVRATAADWCGRGAVVELNADPATSPLSGVAGTHVLSFFPALTSSHQWVVDRLAGAPAPNNCANLP